MKKTRGKEPGIPIAGNDYPALYKENMYIQSGEYTVKVKAFIRDTWDWVNLKLRKSDVDYLRRHCPEFTGGDGIMSSRKIGPPQAPETA